MHNELTCFTCQNRGKTEWCSLGDEDLTAIDNARRELAFKPGQELFRQGDPCAGVYCIESGSVAVRRTDALGNTILVRMAHAGETVGYRCFFAEGTHTQSAEAIRDARVCLIEGRALTAVLDHNPALGLQFLTHMAHDLDDTEEALLQHSHLSVRARVAHLLLSLKDRFGEVTDDGVLVITLPMARQDMAALLGTRPETIARAIHDLNEDGVVRFERRKAMVEDLDDLLDEIEPPAE